MARKFFGTDGIRGKTNEHPMTPDMALKVAMAAAQVLTKKHNRQVVVIGKDTRLSGYMLEPALTAGFVSMGLNVHLVGPMPTPAVAMLTRSFRADLGVMISASHNPFDDNGIKLFGADGYKLSDSLEQKIEAAIEAESWTRAQPAKLGRAKRFEDAPGRYIEFAKNTFDKNLTLDGMRIVIDCANGAAYKVAPTILHELGADVIPMAVEPNGLNINDKCGATSPEALSKRVKEEHADVGIALDGDADRLIIVDEKGKVVDGDQIIALIANSWATKGLLKGDAVVGTIMSNLGMERELRDYGIELIRAPVGDRYVMEEMMKRDLNLGGEQSGHIILRDYTTTGDGLIAALQVLTVACERHKPISEICHLYDPTPQIMVNVRYRDKNPLEDSKIQKLITEMEAKLGEDARLVIRKSGTEPLIRIMTEGEDEALIRSVAEELGKAIEAYQKAA